MICTITLPFRATAGNDRDAGAASTAVLVGGLMLFKPVGHVSVRLAEHVGLAASGSSTQT